MRYRLVYLVMLLVAAGVATPLAAQAPPCRPCAGLVVEDPLAVAVQLTQGVPLAEEARLFLAWRVELDAESGREVAKQVATAGATPWPILVFQTAAPLLQHQDQLASELAVAAAIARRSPPNTHLQIAWEPETGKVTSAGWAYLIKRASVAVSGANSDATVLVGPLPAEPQKLEQIYEHEVTAYLDGVVLRGSAPDALQPSVKALRQLDPGRPVVLTGMPAPSPPALLLANAARAAAAGYAVSLFEAPAMDAAPWLAPLTLLAREFAGDLAYRSEATPEGAAAAWSFVREDLGLRVVVRTSPETKLNLRFDDPRLRRPQLLIPGEPALDLFGLEADPHSVTVPLEAPAAAFVLRLERLTAAEIAGLQGVEASIQVGGKRQIRVEEILSRLQSFEDAQARRLRHWSATRTTHLRFQGQGTLQTVEVTFRGPWFQGREGTTDWAWRELFVNGVKWRGDSIPEIPLVQPEKAAAQPLEILFTREYRYQLRGTETVNGRDCWVVEFEPLPGATGENLYRGTVWIDQEHFARVRTRAVQLGLEGDVISNEESIDYRPVISSGESTEWGQAGSFVLPLHTLSHQIFSVLSNSLVVESESRFREIAINGERFAERRQAVYASESTMVRDTAEGLRYLVPDPDSKERVVKEGFEQNRLFAAAGVFADDSLDYPLPLGGVDWFSFDLMGSGAQANVFFAGLLLQASIADPEFLGTRFDVGADLFAIALPFAETLYRDGEEQPGEEVERRPASLGLSIGHPIGSFVTWELEYGLLHSDFGRTEETDPAFVLPQDHFLHSLQFSTSYSRGGWKLRAAGSWNHRSEWQPWGLPSQPFDPETEEFTTWQTSIARNFYPGSFQRLGLEVEAVGGSNLDRFSKYDFSFFSSPRVHGYQTGKVRAAEAVAAHASYGFGFGEHFRLDLIGDAAWATDEATGLDQELLGGVGLMGTFMGPWQTIVNLDVGFPVAGPEDGFTAYIVFLKLFG